MSSMSISYVVIRIQLKMFYKANMNVTTIMIN
jgi:hypothetical protein